MRYKVSFRRDDYQGWEYVSGVWIIDDLLLCWMILERNKVQIFLCSWYVDYQCYCGKILLNMLVFTKMSAMALMLTEFLVLWPPLAFIMRYLILVWTQAVAIICRFRVIIVNIVLLYIQLAILCISNFILYRQMCESDSRRLLVGNIHVLYNPNRGEVKLGQVSVLFPPLPPKKSYVNCLSSIIASS